VLYNPIVLFLYSYLKTIANLNCMFSSFLSLVDSSSLKTIIITIFNSFTHILIDARHSFLYHLSDQGLLSVNFFSRKMISRKCFDVRIGKRRFYQSYSYEFNEG